MYKRSFIILFMLILAACGDAAKKIEPKGEAPRIEPFLAPIVEKVNGGEGLKEEKAAVKDVIINYNKAVVESQIYMEKLGKLKTLTTKSEYTRMYASLEKDRTDGKILSCTLKELTFKDISLGKDKGVVKTKEEWFFEDRDLKTGRKLSPYKNFEYDVEYNAEKHDGRWVVAHVDIKKAMEFVPPKKNPARVRAVPFQK